jgi:hypothetical protein
MNVNAFKVGEFQPIQLILRQTQVVNGHFILGTFYDKSHILHIGQKSYTCNLAPESLF